MSKLGQIVEAVENYNKFVRDQVKRARTDKKFGRDLLDRWNEIKGENPGYAHTDRFAAAASRVARDR